MSSIINSAREQNSGRFYSLKVGSALLGLAVGLGAFGAHGLKGRVDAGLLDPGLLEAYKTGVQYHFYHALPIFGAGLAGAGLWRGRALGAAVIAWLLGILLFSGSLYAMTFTGIKALGAITPIGGLCFIIGWGIVLFGVRHSTPD